MKAKKVFFMDCHLAGRKYHDVDEVWGELKIGTPLRLERDMDNRYDQNAIAVIYDKKDNECIETEYILGYIPSAENEPLAQFLDMGWNKIFECHISNIKPEAHFEDQIHLTIKIRRNEMECNG